MSKLTKAQQQLLELIGGPVLERCGTFTANYQELCTARALDRKGLADLDSNFRVKITPAGRAALTPNPEGAEQ